MNTVELDDGVTYSVAYYDVPELTEQEFAAKPKARTEMVTKVCDRLFEEARQKNRKIKREQRSLSREGLLGCEIELGSGKPESVRKWLWDHRFYALKVRGDLPAQTIQNFFDSFRAY